MVRFDVAFFASFLALGACSAESSDSATGEDDIHSHPHGIDQTRGAIVVKGPAELQKADVSVRGVPGSKAVGETFDGLVINDYEVNVGSAGDEIRSSLRTQLPVKAATTTTLLLGGAAVHTMDGPNTWALPVLARGLNGSNKLEVVTDRSTGTLFAPALPGEYLFTWGQGDGVVVNVEEGKTAKIDIWDYAQRSVARIVPAGRDLPNACTGQQLAYVSPRIYTSLGEGTYDLSESFEIGQHPRALEAVGQHGPVEVKLQLPCVRGAIVVPLGEKGAGPKELKLGRLDVDDVDLTMPNGSTQKTKGTYRILDANGKDVINFEPPTNTGIDLPPGTYKLVVSYKTTAGTPQSYEETFTTP